MLVIFFPSFHLRFCQNWPISDLWEVSYCIYRTNLKISYFYFSDFCWIFFIYKMAIPPEWDALFRSCYTSARSPLQYKADNISQFMLLAN